VSKFWEQIEEGVKGQEQADLVRIIRKDKSGVDLISRVLRFGRLWYGESNAINNAIRCAKFYNQWTTQ
jgi:hypothetical protein